MTLQSNVHIQLHFIFSLRPPCLWHLTMDPLSVSASILGILTAAGKVVELVQPYVAVALHTPQVAVSILSEVNRMRIVLFSLKRILDNVHTRLGRAAFIQVDQLIVMFTDGVLIFAELEAMLEPLKMKGSAEGATGVANLERQISGGEGWRMDSGARMLWARKKLDIDRLLERLQVFLISLTAMLNIFQCESDVAAAHSHEDLEAQVAKLLHSNQALAARIRDLEDVFNANGALVRRLGSVIQRGDEENEDGDTATITDNAAAKDGETAAITDDTVTELALSELGDVSATDSIFSHAFESDLETSRVYRRAAKNRESLSSCSSSALGSRAWSVFSGLSLADLSVISVIALPLYPADFCNSEHYDFGSQDGKVYHTLPDSYTERDRKTMLSKALMKANNAVLWDNAGNTKGAIEAYNEACGILLLYRRRYAGSDNHQKLQKLDGIQHIYARRIEELLEVLKETHDQDKILEFSKALNSEGWMNENEHSRDFWL
ncbi:hypothetical protein EJ04DRAFT_132590 [Polyplosphaeria fusca]|uniref:MIT domain-containing protein n=1 Tax=Polyplosphaeria fusca TaxID=682080 RepID=A0A9P4QMG3_9PLEO|nr:hypothetical protein EJ04DRAFT_132590 [Polyplosphaeria fusca]